MLKLSGSLKTELIPGTPNDLDKKKFTWEIGMYNNKEIAIKFNYENVKFISAAHEPDTMKITF